MGILKATKSAFSSTGKDQWKDYFYCNSIKSDILMVRGQRQSGKYGSNDGSADIISDGSIVAVADGQAAILVNGGKVTGIFTEPGENVIESGATPSIWTKGGAKSSFKDSIGRIGFGGDVPNKTQRIYYVNTKEISGNSFDLWITAPFRVYKGEVKEPVIDCSVHIAGSFSFKITKPEITYKKLIGNIVSEYKTELIMRQLKTEFAHVMQGISKNVIGDSIRASELTEKIDDYKDSVVTAMCDFLEESRGISIVSMAISVFSVSDSDKGFINTGQRNLLLRDKEYRDAFYITAKADSMRAAAGNAAGIMGVEATDIATTDVHTIMGAATENNISEQSDNSSYKVSSEDKWICECGSENTTKFCMECGSKRPAAEWICDCGSVNTTRFCMMCGAKKNEANWKCKCGALNKGKFCMECGSKRE